MLRSTNENITPNISIDDSVILRDRDGKRKSSLRGKHNSMVVTPSDISRIFQLPTAVTKLNSTEIIRYKHTKRVGSYLIGKLLGTGSFAKVREGMHIHTGEKIAVKAVDKNQAKEDSYVFKNLRREARIMQLLSHPNIIRLLEVVETENSYYMVMELVSGGDVMHHIMNSKNSCLEEPIVKKYVKQIITAIHYMHEAGIVHRDLKVENLLLDDYSNIKIIDFGLSNFIHNPENLTSNMVQTQCGSPAYAAPELLGHKNYGKGVDVWSIGVNMFAMLAGSLPYTVEPYDITALHAKIIDGRINHIPDHITNSCKDLLMRFLTPDPNKRITLAEAMNHMWFKDVGPEIQLVPYPSFLKSDEIDPSVVFHITDKFMVDETELTTALTENRACNISCIYHLTHLRLLRYNKARPANHCKARIGQIHEGVRPSTQGGSDLHKARSLPSTSHSRSRSVIESDNHKSTPSPPSSIPNSNGSKDKRDGHIFPPINRHTTAEGYTRATSHKSVKIRANSTSRVPGSHHSSESDEIEEYYLNNCSYHISKGSSPLVKENSLFPGAESPNSGSPSALPQIQKKQKSARVDASSSSSSSSSQEELLPPVFQVEVLADNNGATVINEVKKILSEADIHCAEQSPLQVMCKWNNVHFSVQFAYKSTLPILEFRWISGDGSSNYSDKFRYVLEKLRFSNFAF